MEKINNMVGVITKENLFQLKTVFNKYNMMMVNKIEDFDWVDFLVLEQ